MRPIIFLDFDGVLNNRRWLLVNQHLRDDVDPERVSFLNQIVEATDAEIVISSTWRILNTIDELKAALSRAGFTGTVLGITPGGGGLRGLQIQQWLDDSCFKGRFVILDDDSDMLHLLPWLVQTDFENGLQQNHVDQAIALLKEKPATGLIP